ncbi:MAG TPA: hypothetical protein VHE34_05515 [Puia sp.]|uniref:hypothetical protein n=1 Tax=Puia sp. TaxID=2045100 RepID=UPI002BECCCA8|nr:hypothetical protein [Puia sp.]HVU94659.1 hypothetical protein [Puia sp.]
MKINDIRKKLKFESKRGYTTLRMAFVAGVCGVIVLTACNNGRSDAAGKADSSKAPAAKTVAAQDTVPSEPAAAAGPIDTAKYNRLLKHLANRDSSGKWPVRTAYPNSGAILPFKRIVAYYGNLYSKRMGVLGEYPPDEMLRMLMGEVKKWQAADTTIPVIPALHYIAVTAQGSAGKDGKYRARMPFKHIDSILHMAARINALVFLDIQVGFSNVQSEVPLLEKYLSMPNVHLGIDAEFAMKPGMRVGKNVGTFDAADVNWCSEYLAKLVKAHNLPPKVFVVHRWTQKMITNYKEIRTRPDVQIVMDMDGWGPQQLKMDTYRNYEWAQPVQFTGFKLFYKNDVKTLAKVKFAATTMMTPTQVLALKPSPIYIQYQ